MRVLSRNKSFDGAGLHEEMFLDACVQQAQVPAQSMKRHTGNRYFLMLK